MTRNQRRASTLAEAIIEREIGAESLDDAEWQPLLLAAGVNHFNSPPMIVAARVIANSEECMGYFEDDESNSHPLPGGNRAIDPEREACRVRNRRTGEIAGTGSLLIGQRGWGPAVE